MAAKDDLGFEEDLGFEPATPTEDLGFKPEHNPLEVQLQEAKDAAAAAQQKAEAAAKAIQDAKNNPKNWTYKQTQDHFKDNPPQNPQAEAQSTALLETKKQQRDMSADSIRQAPPQSLGDTIKEIITRPFRQTPDEKKAHAQNVLAMAHVYDMPASEVERNYDALAAKIVGPHQATFSEWAKTMTLGPIAAGIISNPIATGMGLATFQGIAEVENALVSKLKGQSFEFLKGRSAKDLLPEETNQVTKDSVEILEFIGQGLAAHGVTKAATPVLERFVKDLVGAKKLPEKMYIPSVSGKDVEIPTEKVAVLAQKPNWSSVKDDISVSPTPPEAIKAKQEAHETAMHEAETGFTPDVGDGTVASPQAISAQERAIERTKVIKEGQDSVALNLAKENRGRELSPDEVKAQSFVIDNYSQARANYIKRSIKEFGADNVISADIGKFAIPDMNASKSAAHHEAGSALAKAREVELLADPTTKDLPVAFMAGGSGAGKSNILKLQSGDLQKNFALIYDTNLNNYESAKGKIENVLKSGRDIEISYVYRDPMNAWENGVIPRVKTQDRIVPINEHIKTHSGSRPVVEKLFEEYKDDPRFKFNVYDNSFGKGEFKTINKLDELPSVDYTSIGDKLYESTKAAYNAGKITGEQFRTALAQRPELQARALEESIDFGRTSPDAGQGIKGPGSPTPGLESNTPDGLKERKFITSVRDADKTAPEVAGKIQGDYQPISNEQTLAEAKHVIATDPDAAQAAVEGPSRPTRVTNTIAQLMIDKAQNEGRFEDAIRLVETTARKNTELGQAIQALSMYQRLTPEGILRFATKQLSVQGQKIDPKFGEALVERAKKLQDMPPGRDKDIETALILKDIAQKTPSNTLQKISMVQTIAQLLNPKTMIRNLLGNLTFAVTDNLADTVGTALDMAVSLRTGKRTQWLPDLKTQATGAAQGLKEGTQEALLGIDLKDARTKFDLPKNSVFDTGVMGALEKTMSVALGATDRAFYQAAFNDSLRMQMKGTGLAEASGEMIERAHFAGLYKTFQDENVVSRLFVGLKKALNVGKDFGLGDIVIKYPKTPANLLARGIEYSPFGFVQSAMKLADPLLGRPFDQPKFVHSTARAVTGSALLVGTGAILAQLGIISGKRDKDKDVAAAQQGVGIREYQLNVDALKRFVASGFQADQAKLKKDDTLVTYDWMQPSSLGLALGANMVIAKDKSVTDKVINMADRIFEASETLASQPLVQGLKVITGKQSISEGIADTIQGIPSSFVPTLLNQVRQLTDNTSRNTKDPNYYKEMANKVINKIPGADKTLEPRVTSLGKDQEMYQLGSNNPFNVFLNPTFTSKYNPDPVSDMVLGIWERSGNTAQFPRVASTKIRVGKESIEMNPEQYNEFQAYIGQKTDKLFNLLAASKFTKLPDDTQAKKLQGFLTDINTAAKIEVLGYHPERVHQDVLDIIKGIARDNKKIKKNMEPSELDFEEAQ